MPTLVHRREGCVEQVPDAAQCRLVDVCPLPCLADLRVSAAGQEIARRRRRHHRGLGRLLGHVTPAVQNRPLIRSPARRWVPARRGADRCWRRQDHRHRGPRRLAYRVHEGRHRSRDRIRPSPCRARPPGGYDLGRRLPDRSGRARQHQSFARIQIDRILLGAHYGRGAWSSRARARAASPRPLSGPASSTWSATEGPRRSRYRRRRSQLRRAVRRRLAVNPGGALWVLLREVRALPRRAKSRSRRRDCSSTRCPSGET
jgi:hypothetical protein